MERIQLFTLLAVISAALTLCSAAPIIASSVYKPPHVDLVTYPKLQNINGLEFSNLTALYIRVLETLQPIDWVLHAMAQRLSEFSTFNPDYQTYLNCFVPERDWDSFQGFDIEDRLAKDLQVLLNLTEPLQTSINFEEEYFAGTYASELYDIQEKYLDIMESLSNLTGVPILLSTEPQYDTTTTTINGSDYDEGSAVDTGEQDNSLSDETETEAEEILDRCHGAMSPIFQYANIDELGLAIWFLSLDLKDANERLNPY